MKKLYIRTFGCQMNEYDSDKMADVLHASDGYVKTDSPEDADMILFNTCSVREKAQEKVFSDLGRARELKLKKPSLIIGVGGCVASQEGAAITKRAPYVDIVFGPQTLHRLPQLLEARRNSSRPQVDISFPEIEKFDHLPPARVAGASAYVSIMEGCSKYCSYCVVPYTRGEEVSRPFNDVLAEVAHLATQGVLEITLLGQNVNAYIGEMADGHKVDLALLLEYAAAIPGVQRLRYTTSHPNEFTQRLVDAYASIPALANHVHLPVQHGSDRVLATMKRGYTTLQFKSTVRALRRVRPDISITSDFIVGFPGETEDDFVKLLQLVDAVKFDHSYCFTYSVRPGTPAANLADDVPADVKLARLHRLQAAIEVHAQAMSRAMVGSTQRVLVEGKSRKNHLPSGAVQMQARTECNRVVHFDGQPQQVGQLLSMRITEALPHSLRGEVLHALQAQSAEAEML